MDRNVIHLEISDWNDEIEDPRILEIHEECSCGPSSKTPFNYSLTYIDMAQVVCITTTKEDLQKYGLEFLDTPSLKPSLCTPNCWREYKPEEWENPDKNGLFFEMDSCYRNKLWLCVDKRGTEYLTNFFPYKLEEWIKEHPEAKEKTEKYYKNWIFKPDFFNYFEGDELPFIPVFKRFVYLPHGFIENYLGHPLTYEDEPVKYTTYKFEDLQLWKD